MTAKRESGHASDEEYRRALSAWLITQEAPTNDAAELTYHLGDIREALRVAAGLLEELPNVDPNSSEGRKHLASLTGELFDHLGEHLRLGKRPLVALMKRHYRSADARGEL